MSPSNTLYRCWRLLLLEVFQLPPAESRSSAPRVRPSSLTTHIVSLCCSTGNSTSLSHARCHLVALGWHVILWQSLSCREESPSGQGCRSSLLHLTCCFPCSTGNSLSCYFTLRGICRGVWSVCHTTPAPSPPHWLFAAVATSTQKSVRSSGERRRHPPP